MEKKSINIFRHLIATFFVIVFVLSLIFLIAGPTNDLGGAAIIPFLILVGLPSLLMSVSLWKPNKHTLPMLRVFSIILCAIFILSFDILFFTISILIFMYTINKDVKAYYSETKDPQNLS